MEVGNLSIKEYNRKLLKNRKRINLEKKYETDNYLIKTIRRTKKTISDLSSKELENNLKYVLKKIYREGKLLNDPTIKAITKENNSFKSEYTKLMEKFQNSTLITFHDLISLYKNKGYKIPNLNSEHNLFRVNPLIEENTNKISYYFLTQQNVTTKKDVLLSKSLLFLLKLNELIGKNNNNNETKKIRRKSVQNKSTMISKKINPNEKKENLKKSIRRIKNLINDYLKNERKESQESNIYNSKINNLSANTNSQKLAKTSKILDYNNLTSRNVTNNNLNILSLTERNNNYNDSLRFSEQNNYLKNDNTPKSNILNKSKEAKSYVQFKKINELVNKKNENNSVKSFKNYSDKKNYKNEGIYNNNFTDRNKGIRRNLNLKMFSQTMNFKKLCRLEKRTQKNLPLFIRTQTIEKNSNKCYNIEPRNRNYLYSPSFTNKTEFFNFANNRLKKGKFDDIDVYVKKYLNEIESRTNDETNYIISKYNYKNFKNNLDEIEKYIQKSELDRKTERIYLNNFISRRIGNSLKSMKEKENQISRLNKIASTLEKINK
jgi:hypothetical protein